MYVVEVPLHEAKVLICPLLAFGEYRGSSPTGGSPLDAPKGSPLGSDPPLDVAWVRTYVVSTCLPQLVCAVLVLEILIGLVVYTS